MSDVSPLLSLPYIQPAQAQKHVTHNEALRRLDAIVQLAVESAAATAPPPAPVAGQRWIVPDGATGAWAGESGRIALWDEGDWTFVVPAEGWLAWDREAGRLLVRRAAGWEPVAAGGSGGGGTVALLDPVAQTFAGATTFAAASVTVGTATGTASYGLGTGATGAGATKTVNLGTGGGAGSTTVVNVGSGLPDAGGMFVVHSPEVQFAASVAEINAPAAGLRAQRLGLGGATADATNRLSLNAPATLLNHDGGGHEVTVNKAAAGADASLAFKTGFSARALIGLLGSDDLALKVSADGATFDDALRIEAGTARAEFSEPLLLPARPTPPAPPPAGRIALYARSRAGAPWPEIARAGLRDLPLQPHVGLTRPAFWAPSSGTTINTEGLPVGTVGTVSTPTLATTSLAASMRRWRVTSAAAADAAADQRSTGWACWRGNAAGLGGFTLILRLSLTTLQATGMGFFGLYGSVAALSTSLALTGLTNAVGFGFQRGTHAHWQVVHNDGTGSPTLADLGAAFPVATSGVLTLHLWAAPAASSVWLRLVNEESGAVAETEVLSDLPAPTQLLAPRLFLNTGATAAAVAFDCAGLYLETEF